MSKIIVMGKNTELDTITDTHIYAPAQVTFILKGICYAEDKSWPAG